MPKGVIEIPEVDQSCKDGKCGHIHKYPFELPEPKTQPATIHLNDNITTTQATSQVQLEKPDIIEKIPSHLPKYKCRTCDTYHENKTFKRPKGKCENCGQFAQEDKGHCPTCAEGELEPIDDEELDDLGIPKSKEPIHEEE